MQSLTLETIKKREVGQTESSSINHNEEVLVSFIQEIPEYLTVSSAAASTTKPAKEHIYL